MNEKKIEPFFARFLEGQIKVKAGVKAGIVIGSRSAEGKGAVTLKFPSDSDEAGAAI